jgi:hypothetical protein
VQLGEVDDDVARGLQGGRERPTTTTAGRAVLVSGDAQDPELFVERDDSRKLVQTGG